MAQNLPPYVQLNCDEVVEERILCSGGGGALVEATEGHLVAAYSLKPDKDTSKQGKSQRNGASFLLLS